MPNEDLSNCVITTDYAHLLAPGDYVDINGTTFKVASASQTQFTPRALTRWERFKMIVGSPFAFISYQGRRLYYRAMNTIDRWAGIDD